MRKSTIHALCACAAVMTLSSITSNTVSAETVYVPIGQQASHMQEIERPEQGMTKVQVEEKFGQPRDWRRAVGDPPISSWIYNDFTVYFEYEHVIHSVLTHQPIN